MVTKPVTNIVTNKEVPGTNLVGIPIKYIIAGTIKNAPPTPIIAETKPTITPNKSGTKALAKTVGKGVLKRIPLIGAGVEGAIDAKQNEDKFGRIKEAYENQTPIIEKVQQRIPHFKTNPNQNKEKAESNT